MISSSLIIRIFLVAWRSGAGLRPDTHLVRCIGDVLTQRFDWLRYAKKKQIGNFETNMAKLFVQS